MIGWLRVVRARLVSWLVVSRLDRELDEEIRDHLDRVAADHRSRGMAPEAARAAALAEFGSVLATREAHGELRTMPFLEHLGRDTRHSIRTHLKAPLYATVVVATLALGIGATSAIFALVNAVVLRPLPFPDSDALAEIEQVKRDTGAPTSVSPPNFFDLQSQTSAWSGMAAYWTPAMRLAVDGGLPERVFGTVCTANLLEVLGVMPAAGRHFTDADDRPGADRVAIVSDRLWRRRFGGDPSIVGRKILVDDTPTVVIGIMPPDFAFPAGSDLWTPVRLSRTEPPSRAIPAARYRQYRILSVVARLKPQMTLARAGADLATVFSGLERQYPDANRHTTATAVALHDAIVGDVRPAMLVLFAAVGCLWLIAAANVATLFAVRTTSRDRDITLRRALGASRGRIAQQMLVDSVLVGLFGGALGLAVAWSFLGVMLRLAPSDIPRLETVRIDADVVLFTIAIAVGSGVLLGVMPALQAGRRSLIDALKSGGRSTATVSQQRFRRGIVIVEIALSMLLLVTAALLTQTLMRLGRVDLGFQSESVFTFDRLEMPRGTTPVLSAAFFDELLRTLRNTRGIGEAGLTIGVPLDAKARFFIDESAVELDSRTSALSADRPTARLQVVTSGYFSALRVPLVAGRGFADRDAPDAPAVALVNQAFADRYFPNGDAVGHVITHELSIVPGQQNRRQIVGIVGNVRQFRLDDPFEPQVFVPHAQMPWPAMALVIQSPLGADRVAPIVRQAVSRLNPRVLLPVPAVLSQTFDDALGQPRLRAWLVNVFAATALLLASIGLYGTIAFAIEQRKNELAIRLVLGASAWQTRSLVMRDGLAIAAGGTILGAVAAFVAMRLVSGLLFGISAFDPVTVALAAMLLIGIAALASYLPARRIDRIDAVKAINASG
jgi:putative ABC transport system permease protein